MDSLDMDLDISLLDKFSDYIICLDHKLTITYVNQAAAVFYGWNVKTTIGQHYVRYCQRHAWNLPALLEDKNTFARLKAGDTLSQKVHGENDSVVEWEIFSYPKTASTQNIILIGKDVTLFESALHQKQDVELRIKSIIDALPGNYWWKDLEGRYLGCNQNVAKTLGLPSPDYVIGKTDYELPWADRAEILIKHDKEVAEQRKTARAEEKITTVSGDVLTFLVVKVPLCNSAGEVIGTIGTSIDVTDKKQLEDHLINAKKKAEAANQAKTEFLQNMRHDIRTPLAGISGFAELIKHESQDSNIAEYADNLNASCLALQDFLNSILEAIRVFSGDVPVVKKKFLLREYITNVVDLNRAAAADKKLTLDVHLDDHLPEIVMGDPKRLHRILLELLTNAIKFTDQGAVKLSALLSETFERRAVITFMIKDDGKGLSDTQKNDIFTQFKRLTPAYEGRYKGLGMGLTMVKQFVEELDGEIYVDSSTKEGTLFTINLPFSLPLTHDHDHIEHITQEQAIPVAKKAADMLSPATESLKTSGPNVLFVEDNPLAAKVGSAILIGINCQVDIAEDGTTALGKYQAQSYDMIFMDVGLPDLDGCEVTKRIRQHELTTDKHIPIIALTAHIDKENKQRCIEYGMDAVLSKPLARDKALDILSYFLPGVKKPTEQAEGITDVVTTLPEKTIDLEAAAQVVGDPDLAKNMLTMLMTDSVPKVLSDLQHAYDKADWKTIKFHVHKLLGGTAYCGVPRLMMACQQLERCLDGGNTDKQEALFQQLLDEITRLKEEYKKLS